MTLRGDYRIDVVNADSTRPGSGVLTLRFVGRRPSRLHKLVDAARKQADLVRDALADDAVEVRSVLCFVEADWPFLGGDFVVRDVTVTWPKKLAATIARPGPQTEEQIAALHQRLATAFPPA
ncbi:hypothetical protein [Ornithinimicrobium cerasi]|uniref:Uncharacterized protein n=1 Tax=Ornithinimicrobium cerasi TaxID=2248773 RepID=A0A285VJM2_9MICO|nr:hypothetical protein [Ornithinimicrobium cerasi]SOC53738.1 hypothetical protein SAMN05421879_10298 [Ornithinimicrobium cerasi]